MIIKFENVYKYLLLFKCALYDLFIIYKCKVYNSDIKKMLSKEIEVEVDIDSA